MARTALDMTNEELRAYRPVPRTHSLHDPARMEQAWEVARAAARLLRGRFGAERVVAFGSLARGDVFTFRSDIDLAAWGIPPRRYYEALTALDRVSTDFRVDLVTPEDRSPSLHRSVHSEGVDL